MTTRKSKGAQTALSVVIVGVLIYLFLKFGPALLKALTGAGSNSSARYSNASNPYGSGTPFQQQTQPQRRSPSSGSPISFPKSPAPSFPKTQKGFGQWLYDLTHAQTVLSDPSIMSVTGSTGTTSGVDQYQIPDVPLELLDLSNISFPADTANGAGFYGGIVDSPDPSLSSTSGGLDSYQFDLQNLLSLDNLPTTDATPNVISGSDLQPTYDTSVDNFQFDQSMFDQGGGFDGGGGGGYYGGGGGGAYDSGDFSGANGDVGGEQDAA
jgi:hypothetical protein